MSVIRSFTVEKQAVNPAGSIYFIPHRIPNGNIILSSARIDLLLATPNVYASIPKSVTLEIGNIVGDFVIDNDPYQNFFKVILELNIVNIDGDSYLSSITNPNTSFLMSGDLDQNFKFIIRDQTGTILDPAFFSFHFTVVSAQ